MAGKTLMALVVAGAFLAVSAGMSLAGGMGHKSKTSGKSGTESMERKDRQVFGREDAWRIQEPVETGEYPRIHWEERSGRLEVGGQEYRTIDLGP
jgi:hypothetical protein